MAQQPVLYDPTKCPCQKASCERNHNCEACKAFHHDRGGMTRCERQAKQSAK